MIFWARWVLLFFWSFSGLRLFFILPVYFWATLLFFVINRCFIHKKKKKELLCANGMMVRVEREKKKNP